MHLLAQRINRRVYDSPFGSSRKESAPKGHETTLLGKRPSAFSSKLPRWLQSLTISERVRRFPVFPLILETEGLIASARPPICFSTIGSIFLAMPLQRVCDFCCMGWFFKRAKGNV